MVLMICQKPMSSKQIKAEEYKVPVHINYLVGRSKKTVKSFILLYFSASLDLDYFEEAVDLLLERDEVQKDKGLGLIGISKSGDIVLEMAAYLPSNKIKAVVAMNCMPNALVTDVDYKGKRVLSCKYEY